MDIVRAVCNRLSKTPSHTPHAVIITEKDEEKGLRSLEHLRHPTVRVGFHQLDACNDRSRTTFFKNLKEQFGSVDVVINNSDILPSTKELGSKRSTGYILKEDYYEAKVAIFALIPLMAPGGRVVIGVSSLAELAIRWMNENAFAKLFSASTSDKASYLSLQF
ncbi:hypothetical protein, conserved [Eimeria maxima]|uniref:Uncharacterized protein n=1 Tax=Eimeria maxima TaxID=5804 RepID=U6MAT1_EIMMA|nr:hypothetical protein, conserved [Eimeria maxima]CDJ61131.1 hypothetical protein, conserved [Eimeria maxima]